MHTYMHSFQRHTKERAAWWRSDDRSACRELKSISNREVCCYSISAKNAVNIDITLQWLTKHAKSNNK
jgi:hypothetical protein